MTIYNSTTGAVIYDGPIDDSSTETRSVMGENVLEVTYVTPQVHDYSGGAHVVYGDERWFLTNMPYPTRVSNGYKYSLQFYDLATVFSNFMCVWHNFINHQHRVELSFTLTSDLAGFNQMICDGCSEFYAREGNNEYIYILERGGENVAGEDAPQGYQPLSFNGSTVKDALNSIAEAFDTEWDLSYHRTYRTGTGNIIMNELYYQLNFRKYETGEPITIEEGEKVMSITANSGNDSEYGTHFYCFGDTRNLPSSYSPNSASLNHLGEIRLHLPRVTYPDSLVIADGKENTAYPVYKYVVFDDEYPKNEETVMEVRWHDANNEHEQYEKCSILTASIFDRDSIADGISNVRLTFIDGQLSGKEFGLERMPAKNDAVYEFARNDAKQVLNNYDLATHHLYPIDENLTEDIMDEKHQEFYRLMDYYQSIDDEVNYAKYADACWVASNLLERKVIFQNIEKWHYNNDYLNNNVNEFFLTPIVEPNGTDGNVYIPNRDLAPQVGDTIVLSGVYMPDEKITLAEEHLAETARKYAAKHSRDMNVYECKMNPVTLAEELEAVDFDVDELPYQLGAKVTLHSQYFDSGVRQSRIQGFTRKINAPWDMTLSIGNNERYSLVKSLRQEAKKAAGKSLYSVIGSTNITGASDTSVLSSRATEQMIKRTIKQMSNETN